MAQNNKKSQAPVQQMEKEYLSTSEVAKLLDISRVAVFKKIRAGKITAEKFGRNYLVSRSAFAEALGDSLSKERKEEIDTTVKKIVREYRNALERLGRE